MKRTAVRFVSALIGAALALTASAAAAEQVEISSGVYVTKKSFPAPADEQPFYGFREKTPQELKADKDLLDALAKKGYAKSYAFNRAMANGWLAYKNGKLDLATRRFNQAYLIDPTQSAVLHAFAVVAQVRFRDDDYAEELFKTGAAMDNRRPGFMADYGRFLLQTGKGREAMPIMEEAVKEAPKDADAWSNLAIARLYAGMRQSACYAAFKSSSLNPPANTARDLKIFAAKAKCDVRL